jgi:hypothetical protein
MKLTLKVDIGDGPLEISTNLFTIVAWERKFKTKASAMSQGIGIEDLAYLAQTAMIQNGISCPVVFDDFVKKLVTLEVTEQISENPTVEIPTDLD